MNLPALRRLLDSACRIFSVCALLLCTFQMLFAAEETVIYPLSFFLLYPFAICFAGANAILRSNTGSSAVRFLCHFALMTLGISLFIFWPAGVFASGSSALVMVCTYLLLYFLIMAGIALVRHHIQRVKFEQTNSYSAQYDHLRSKK